MLASRPSVRAGLCPLVILAVAMPAAAARRLLGTVTDAAGAPLAEAAVKLFDVGGAAPEFSVDRSAVNDAGAGTEAHAARNGAAVIETVPGAERQFKLLKELTTGDDGSFTWATPHFVAALLVQIERPGYQVARVRVAFPVGTSREVFTLHELDKVPAAAAMPAQADQGESPLVLFERGVASLKEKEWEKGRADFAAAVRKKPDFANAWLNLAIANFQLRDFEAALAAAEALLALQPDHPVAKMMVADARAQLAAAAARPTPSGKPETESRPR